jgi:hypothetical protein
MHGNRLKPINQLIATVSNGLYATERAGTWGLSWPNSTTRSPFTNKKTTFTVAVEIINDQGRSIGRQTVTVSHGYSYTDLYAVNMNTDRLLIQTQGQANVTFPAINANLITDRLSIRIISVDGIPAEEAAMQKRVNILPAEEFIKIFATTGTPTSSALFTANPNGILTNYTGNLANVVVPPVVQGVFITFIGRESFWFNEQLTSITIPDSVTSIGNHAFYETNLRSVSIGANVSMDTSFTWRSFNLNFGDAYTSNNSRAGTYTYDGNKWNYSPRR